MVVCVEPRLGLYYRINSEPKWQVPVTIYKSNNPFLDHDSYLECGSPLELDDYLVEESIQENGILGMLHASHIPAICAAIIRSRRIRPDDRQAIRAALGCP